MTTTPSMTQQTFLIEAEKEAKRRERCLRLLKSLGLPPTKLTTGNLFNYDSATRIATGQKPLSPPQRPQNAV